MFKAQELKYDYDALTPYIGTETMETHHGKHYQGYTKKLNAALEGHDDLKDLSIEELLAGLGDLPADIRTAVRQNGGGYYNHTLFFDILSPDPTSAPEGELAEAIEDEFGSFEDFLAEFKSAGKGRFGSGWAWLVTSPEGELSIVDTKNQDNPLMEDGSHTPILGVDIWEHSYYLDYKNERGTYLDNVMQAIDWKNVSERYEAAAE